MKRRKNIKLILMLLFIFVIWFSVADRSFFLVECHDCYFNMDIVQYRIFAFPICSKTRERESMMSYVCKRLGVKCQHKDSSRKLMQRWWGMLIPFPPNVGIYAFSGFEKSDCPEIDSRIQELVKVNPKLPEDFQQRVIIDRDMRYWKEFAKKIMDSNKPDISGEVQELLEKLNSWDKEELDVLEHPDKYPDRVVSGETKGWVDTHKEELKELGFVVKWNRDKKIYELERIIGK